MDIKAMEAAKVMHQLRTPRSCPVLPLAVAQKTSPITSPSARTTQVAFARSDAHLATLCSSRSVGMPLKS